MTQRQRSAPPAALRRWQGGLEGVVDGAAFGWCIDAQAPDARVVVELLLDGEAIATSVADVGRPDRAGRFGREVADPCHGFIADLGPHARRVGSLLRARVANTDACLPGAVHIGDELASSSHAASHVAGDGGLNLQGWIRPGFGGLGTVRAFLGPREVSRTSARADEARGGDASPGSATFTLHLPPALADGQAHSIRVVDEQGAPLHGSPVLVCCHLEGLAALLDGPGRQVLPAVANAYERLLPRGLPAHEYPAWKAAFETAEPAAGRAAAIALVVTNSDEAGAEALARTMRSLEGQSVRPRVIVACRRNTRIDPLPAALAEAGTAGDLIATVRAGDELAPHALASMREAFLDARTLVAYADSEFEGRPWFKPAWNLEYALASDFPLDLLLVRAALASECLSDARAGAGAFAWGALARAHLAGTECIRHVPRLLHFRRSLPLPSERDAAAAGARAALTRIEPGSRLRTEAPPLAQAPFQPRHVVRPLTKRERSLRVSLVVPTRDRVELLRRCIDAVRARTDWPGLEIIVADNDSADPATLAYLRALRRSGVRVLPCPGPFNFAAINNRAVEAAQGTIVGLLNNDVEPLHAGWLEEMVGQLLRPGVGAVGAKLLWPNGMVQHGGVLLGVAHGASHFGHRLAADDAGDHGRNQLLQQVSAVTAACLFIRKRDYLAVGGMDAHAFPVNFNDVDLCLRLRARGLSVVWTPQARLLHAESASRGRDESPARRARASRELDQLRARWGAALGRDPAYHPSLALDPALPPFGGLAAPPRDRSPRTFSVLP